MMRAALLIALACTGAHAEPVTCPPAQKVNVGASAEGWQTYIVADAYDKPKIAFNNMRVRGDVVMCQYDVAQGTVRLRLNRTCVPAGGKWEDKGSSQLCMGPEPAACRMDCK